MKSLIERIAKLTSADRETDRDIADLFGLGLDESCSVPSTLTASIT